MQLKPFTRLLPAILCLWAVTTGAEEQLEQDTIVIKGNPGLPGTLYIAPWKRVDAPLQSGALEGEVGEESKPLERDLFQRELELQREGYSVEQPPPPRTPPAATVDSGATR
jgi:hypothetical protein